MNCVISFNIIHRLEPLIVLDLPLFELHNSKIDWRKWDLTKKQTFNFQVVSKSKCNASRD